MILVVLREAEVDIEEAFRWYETRRVGLGNEFFPYLVYFREHDDAVRIFGVLHGRRDRSPLRRRTTLP